MAEEKRDEDLTWIERLIQSLMFVLTLGNAGKWHSPRFGASGGEGAATTSGESYETTTNGGPGSGMKDDLQQKIAARTLKTLSSVKYADGDLKMLGKFSNFLNENTAGRIIKGTGMIALAKIAFPAYAVVNLTSAFKELKKEKKIRRESLDLLNKERDELLEKKPEGYEEKLASMTVTEKALQKKDYITKFTGKVTRTAVMSALVGGAFATGGALAIIPATAVTAALIAPIGVKLGVNFVKKAKNEGLAKALTQGFTKEGLATLATVAIPAIAGALVAGEIQDNIDMGKIEDLTSESLNTVTNSVKTELGNITDATKETINEYRSGTPGEEETLTEYFKNRFEDTNEPAEEAVQAQTPKQVADAKLAAAQGNYNTQMEQIQDNLEVSSGEATTNDDLKEAMTTAEKARVTATSELKESIEAHKDTIFENRIEEARTSAEAAEADMHKATQRIEEARGPDDIIKALEDQKAIAQNTINMKASQIDVQNQYKLDEAIEKMQEENPDWSDRKMAKGIEKLTEAQREQTLEQIEVAKGEITDYVDSQEETAVRSLYADQPEGVRTTELLTSKEVDALNPAERAAYGDKIAEDFRKNELIEDNLEHPRKISNMDKSDAQIMRTEFKDEIEAISVKNKYLSEQLTELVGEEKAEEMMSSKNHTHLDKMKANLESKAILEKNLNPEMETGMEATTIKQEVAVSPEGEETVVKETTTETTAEEPVVATIPETPAASTPETTASASELSESLESIATENQEEIIDIAIAEGVRSDSSQRNQLKDLARRISTIQKGHVHKTPGTKKASEVLDEHFKGNKKIKDKKFP